MHSANYSVIYFVGTAIVASQYLNEMTYVDVRERLLSLELLFTRRTKPCCVMHAK